MEIAHISCAPHTHELDLAQPRSAPNQATQQDILSSIPTYVTGCLPVQVEQGGGGADGGISERSSTQTGRSGYSNADDSRPPSVIPVICSNHPSSPTNTSNPASISLSPPQLDGLQRQQHTATDDAGISYQRLTVHPYPQNTTNGAGCNSPLVGSFTVSTEIAYGASGNNGAASQIVCTHSDPRAPVLLSDSEASCSSAQGAAGRVQTIPNGVPNTNVSNMNPGMDTTRRATPSRSPTSPVPNTPNVVALSVPSANGDGIPKVEMTTDASHASSQTAMYAAGGPRGLPDSLIFQ